MPEAQPMGQISAMLERMDADERERHVALLTRERDDAKAAAERFSRELTAVVAENNQLREAASDQFERTPEQHVLSACAINAVLVAANQRGRNYMTDHDARTVHLITRLLCGLGDTTGEMSLIAPQTLAGAEPSEIANKMEAAVR